MFHCMGCHFALFLTGQHHIAQNATFSMKINEYYSVNTFILKYEAILE